ncbi:hypothetical protein Droror1_Dr00006889 [Drosera rotundifolia]
MELCEHLTFALVGPVVSYCKNIKGIYARCPACRNYKPYYEKVARLFNGPDAPHPGIILMARVDCALKRNPHQDPHRAKLVIVGCKWNSIQQSHAKIYINHILVVKTCIFLKIMTFDHFHP